MAIDQDVMNKSEIKTKSESEWVTFQIIELVFFLTIALPPGHPKLPELIILGQLMYDLLSEKFWVRESAGKREVRSFRGTEIYHVFHLYN